MLTMLLPALLALPQTPKDPPQTATVILPLQQLCSRERELGNPPWGTMLRFVSRDDRPADLVLNASEFSSLSADGIVDALMSIEAQAMDEEKLYLQPIGNNLLAFGEQAIVQRVRDYLDQAARIIARPLQVEFAIWAADDREAPDTVLDPNEYAKFASNNSPLWTSIGTGRSSQAIVLEHMSWSRYVRGIDVEVAQKQALSRPSTNRYGEGGHAVVRAHSLIGSDDFAVHVQFAVGQKRGVVRSLQTGMPGAADIELPRLESYFGACSGRIPNGGALAATMRGNPATGGQLVLTFRVLSRQPPATMSSREIAILPCGALTTRALTQQHSLPDIHGDDQDHYSFEGQGTYGHIPSDNLIELAQGVFESSDEGEWDVQFADGYLYVRGSAAAVTRVESMVRGMQDRLVQNVKVKHIAQLRPLQSDTSTPPTRPTLHELSLPSLLGREVVAYRLLETNIVADVFIEVAQEAGSLVPHIRRLQSGTWFRSRAVPLADNMHVDLDVVSASAPTPPMRSVMPGGGVLMQGEVATSQRYYDGVLDRGLSIEHGDGPKITIEGRTYRSSMTTFLSR